MNAGSSLAYLAAGAVMARRVARGSSPRPVLLLAAATAAEGFGSTWYHGPAGRGSQAAHDLPLMAMSGYLAGWHLHRASESEPDAAGPDRTAALALFGALVAGGGLWRTRPEAVNLAVAVGAGLVVSGEMAARLSGQEPIWDAPLLALGAASLSAWWVGRSASSLCNPGSLFQPHAIWHLGTAALIVGWVTRTTKAKPLQQPRRIEAV